MGTARHLPVLHTTTPHSVVEPRSRCWWPPSGSAHSREAVPGSEAGARSTEKGQQRRLQGVHEDGGEGEGGEVGAHSVLRGRWARAAGGGSEGFPVHVYNVLVSTEYFLLLQEQFLRHQRQHLASGVGAGTGAGAGGTASRAPRISRAMTEALDMAVGGGGGAAARTAEREVEVPSAVATAAAVAALSPCSGNSLSEALRGDVNITDPRCINKVLTGRQSQPRRRSDLCSAIFTFKT